MIRFFFSFSGAFARRFFRLPYIDIELSFTVFLTCQQYSIFYIDLFSFLCSQCLFFVFFGAFWYIALNASICLCTLFYYPTVYLPIPYHKNAVQRILEGRYFLVKLSTFYLLTTFIKYAYHFYLFGSIVDIFLYICKIPLVYLLIYLLTSG